MLSLCPCVLSGVWVVPTSCSWDLSVEPICRPSALQCLLVCSVRRAAVLRHHEWKCLTRPSGNSVLPAHKVGCERFQWSLSDHLRSMHWCIYFYFLFPLNVQCLRVLCHSLLSFRPDLCGVLSCSRAAQPMQVLPGRLCSCSEWKRYAQVR